MMLAPVLVASVLVPVVGGLGAGAARIPTTARRIALSVGAVAGGLGLFVAANAVLHAGAGAASVSAGGVVLLRADGAGAMLLATTSVIAFAALVTTARRGLDGGTARSVLVGSAGTSLALMAGTPWLLVVGWCVSLTPLVSARAGRSTARVASGVLVGSTGLIGFAALGGVLVADGTPASMALAPWRSGALVLAVVLRAAVPPFHGWAPWTLDRGPTVLAVPVLFSPLPILVLARHVAAYAPSTPWLTNVLLALGVAGAASTALVAMVQHDLRRVLGYLAVSASCGMVAALGSATPAGLAGAVFAANSAAIALSCAALLVEAVVSRTGTADVRRLGGLHAAMPLASAAFLIASLALVGFPGTSGFVAEDLVMQALVPRHPVLAVVLLGTVALNGVTLYRAYARTFLGPASLPEAARIDSLLPRERAVCIGLCAALVLVGVAPLPLVPIRAALAIASATHGAGTGVNDGASEDPSAASDAGTPTLSAD